MGMVGAVRSVLRKYATFSDRASRSEYWWFFLALMLVQIATVPLDLALFGIETTAALETTAEPRNHIGTALMLATIIPLLAVGWRRMHDIGRSGWWLLLPLLGAVLAQAPRVAMSAIVGSDPSSLPDGPLLPALLLTGVALVFGSLALTVWWLASRGASGDNAYGPAPA